MPMDEESEFVDYYLEDKKDPESEEEEEDWWGWFTLANETDELILDWETKEEF